MPNGPFGSQIYYPGGMTMQLPTPAFLQQDIPPEYARAIGVGTPPYIYQELPRDYQNAVGAGYINPRDLSFPQNVMEAGNWSEVLKQSGVSRLFDKTGDALGRARDTFLDWLYTGPKTNLGANARAATMSGLRGVEKLRDVEFVNGATPAPEGGVGIIDWLNAPPSGEGYQIPKLGFYSSPTTGPDTMIRIPGFGKEANMETIDTPYRGSPRALSAGDKNYDGEPPLPSGPANVVPANLLAHIAATDPLNAAESGYSALGNIGAGADLESDPADLAVAIAEANDTAMKQAAVTKAIVKTAASKSPSEQPDWGMALASLGFGMAASKNPKLAGAAGEGGLLAVQSLKQDIAARKAGKYKERELDILESRAKSASISAAAALLKASTENLPTKAKEYDYLKSLGWTDDEAATGVGWMKDLDSKLLETVVQQTSQMAAMGVVTKPEDMAQILKNAKAALAQVRADTPTSARQETANSAKVKRVVRGPDGKLILQ